MLLSSMVYAADVAVAPASEPVIQPSQNQIISQPVIQSRVQPTLWIDPEMPNSITLGVPFWVDFYVAPVAKTTIGNSLIQVLTSDQNTAQFNGNVQLDNKSFDLSLSGTGLNGVTVQLQAQGTGVNPIYYNISSGSKVKLFSAQMVALKSGSFSFSVGQNSFSLYNGSSQATYAYYVLNVRSPRRYSPTNAVCIPSTSCPQNSCGSMSDGCGGLVNCALVCVEGQTCANNACVPALSKVLPANAPQHDKTVLEQVSNSLSNGQLNKLQKLASIVNAVKAWLAAQ